MQNMLQSLLSPFNVEKDELKFANIKCEDVYFESNLRWKLNYFNNLDIFAEFQIEHIKSRVN